MKKHCVTKRSPGCGSQRLLRCRSHPAGRGPNSSSLFPPLAAVVAVASGLTGTTMTVSPTKRKAPLEVATPRGFFLFGVTILTLDIPDFRIPDPPQKFTVTLPLAFIVSFCRSLWYTYFAALPAHFIREGGESNELYSIFCSVCRSKCNVVLHLQVD